MNETQRAKIRAFISDKVMAETVREVIEGFVVVPKSREVTYLAGQMIALEILKDAWRNLERFKEEKRDDTDRGTPHV